MQTGILFNVIRNFFEYENPAKIALSVLAASALLTTAFAATGSGTENSASSLPGYVSNGYQPDVGTSFYRGRGMMGYNGEYGNYSGMMYSHSFGYFSVFHILLWILGLFLVVAIIRRMVWKKHAHCHWHHHSEELSDNAMNLLRERYAKGEIEKAEFEEKKKDLLS